ncbi:hypothetical protein BaRGS_00006772 [Batillaria attramentaria]|uniref:RRM domain-containing protein n=1 Tax=Batillaria attramentaria TaxID=370345 RepID=A0ABD0LRW8_9CAEN
MARYDPDRKGYRIFVGNLTSATSHDDLADLFNHYGPIVDIWLACNPPGFGFVVFKNASDAEKAAYEKNNSILKGRVIKVQHARLFRDRSKRITIGLHDDSDQSNSRSRSRSRSWSRSRSRSRSSLDSFSKIYGASRPRSRTRSRQRSVYSSRSRSRSSRLTASEKGSRSRSSSRSQSRPRSRSRSSAKAKSR